LFLDLIVEEVPDGMFFVLRRWDVAEFFVEAFGVVVDADQA
jgi:hypothetical protein